jgi:putative nucleotidyltransferase with HDIG domain
MKPKVKQISASRKQSPLASGWRSSTWVRFAFYALIGIVSYFLLLNPVLPKQYDLKPGAVSPETIVAPVTKIDQKATEQVREEAAQSVPLQYRKDEQITSRQLDRLERIYDQIRGKAAESASEKEKIEQLRALIPALSDDFYKTMVRIPEKEIPEMRSVSRDVLQQVLSEGVRPAQLVQKREQAGQLLEEAYSRGKARDAAGELVRALIVPNVVVDKALTDALRETARESVKPVIIQKGDVIVAAGEVVTEEKIRELKELGLLRHNLNYRFYSGLSLFLLIWLALLYVCVRRFHPEIHADNSKVLMMAAVFVLNLLAMKVVSLGQDLEWSTVGYCAPFAFGTMLIALLLDTRLAIWFGVLFSLAAGIFFNDERLLLFDYRYGLVALVSGTAGALALAGVRNRPSILRAGLFASFAATAAIVALHLLVPAEGDLRVFLQSVGFGLLSGVISAVLTIGFLSLFETVFDILSPLRLLELSNPNHPLLRKLLVEAPGTYHHSVMVANLAESAAEAIGADGLLARVGSYYHDIGKLKRPQFYIENQMQLENPHDKISPHLSKTIILSHPRDGVEMLEAHRIPKPIRDIAAQHHGTTLLKYFYLKAKEISGDSQVLEEDFRYPGPKAQFKEAAIVGIADSIEAAVRSLSRPTPGRIESIVRKVIRERLEDGQFNECDLTLKELEMIGRSMCETLQGIFHARIEYPEEVSGKGKDVKNGVVG